MQLLRPLNNNIDFASLQLCSCLFNVCEALEISLGGLFLFYLYIHLCYSVILSSNICFVSFMCFSFVLFTDASITQPQPFTEAPSPLKGEHTTTVKAVIHSPHSPICAVSLISLLNAFSGRFLLYTSADLTRSSSALFQMQKN